MRTLGFSSVKEDTTNQGSTGLQQRLHATISAPHLPEKMVFLFFFGGVTEEVRTAQLLWNPKPLALEQFGLRIGRHRFNATQTFTVD